MGLNFPVLIYQPCFDLFARPVIITPLASQPGAPAYTARGIFDTNQMDIESFGEEENYYSSTRTELDILDMDFSGVPLPMQGDRVSIPQDQDLPGGEFFISDTADRGNAGGETTLVLKACEEWKLVGYDYALGGLDFARPVLTVA